MTLSILGFGSAVLLAWLLLTGLIDVNAWLAIGAFIFFIMLGLGSAIADFTKEFIDVEKEKESSNVTTNIINTTKKK